MQTQQFDTTPLLRPHQVQEAKDEIAAAEQKLKSPHIEDKAEVAKQLRRLNKAFSEQAPQPPLNSEEEGRMVARSQALLDDILVGMPSQEEMRKAPPGAVDKHMKWEKRNKLKILEWKNLQLRLTHGEETEAAVLERHRPIGSTLNMDNAYIPGKMFFMPPAGAARPVAFSDEQIALLRQLNPELANMLGTLPNEARAEVKTALTGGIGLSDEYRKAASIAGKRGVEKREANRKKHKGKVEKHPLTDEQKAAMKAGREAYWAKKKAA